MKITSSQLRSIIKEEVSKLNEAADLGAALSSGTLAGVGRGVIKSALIALSDADFDKFRLAFKDASNERKAGSRAASVKSAAADLDPVKLATSIQNSLKTLDWSWSGYSAGRSDFSKQEAVKAALDSALGPGAGDEFEGAVIYAAGDDDTFRKMTPAEADRLYDSSVKKIKQMAAKLG
jgi:hypothetical protein